jgi:hypothetical protein
MILISLAEFEIRADWRIPKSASKALSTIPPPADKQRHGERT